MKNLTAYLLIAVCAVLLPAGCARGADDKAGENTPVPPQWQLSSQAWTFRSYTLFETLDKLKGLGIEHIEMYPGQRIGGGVEGKTHHSMDEATRAKIKAKLAETGIKAVAYGVVGARDENGWRQIMEFATAMGMSTVTSEPAEKDLEMLDALCEEYGLKLAIHNHPKPSHYWNVDTVLKACEGRSARIGACADTGHWVRSGLDPVESLRKLKGRVVSVHFKDLAKDANVDVPWGTGRGQAALQFAELKKQGFAGVLSIEYEHNSPTLLEDVAECVAFHNKCASASAGELARLAVETVGTSWDVSDTWKYVKAEGSGKWPKDIVAPSDKAKPVQVKTPKPTASVKPDLSGYKLTTGPGKGTVKAIDKAFPGEGPENAFDNSPKKWCVNQKSVWIQYTYSGGVRHIVTAYALTSGNDVPGRDPKEWQVLGSNDGADWHVVDERSDEDFEARYQQRLFKVAKPGEYSHYMLKVANNHGDVSFQISELELLADDKPGASSE
jgi:sugar phosphate isomerase/epimerase